LAEIKGVTEIIGSGDTAGTSPPETPAAEAWEEARDCGLMTKPFKIRKRIGYTAYEVEVYFNPASRETLDDKILRLVRGEAMKGGGL
jgi:hypothetical protein